MHTYSRLFTVVVVLCAWVANAPAQIAHVDYRLSEPGVILGYSTVDASYSSSLQRIVTLSSNPHLLHFVDPASLQDEAMALPHPPMNFSLSSDGRFAVVNHGFLLSYIDLSTRSILKTFEPE